MSEDRTQPASKRRLQMARENGHVAHSPELTAAGGWVAGVLALGFWGRDLMSGLVGLVQASLAGDPILLPDARVLTMDLRHSALALAAPFGLIVAASSAGAMAAHQLQVRGLWATGHIAPDLGRLWRIGQSGNLTAAIERLAWALVKAVVLTSIACWVIRGHWAEIQQLGMLPLPELATASGRLCMQAACILTVAMLVLGLGDLGLRHYRYQVMLRTTPEEQREDLRVMEGDPTLRAKRRRLARAWRGDSVELLARASLVVSGQDGLTVVLVGGPPPRRVIVRHAAQGPTGEALRRSAHTARVPQIEAAPLALRLARHVSSTGTHGPSLPEEFHGDLTALWPVGERR